jgi:hypothetical protein
VTERRTPLGAILFSIRDSGLDALNEPMNLSRLARLDAVELADLHEEIAKIIRERREAVDAPPPAPLRRRER